MEYREPIGRILALSGFACNGKTTMLPDIRDMLKSTYVIKYPSLSFVPKIFVIKEPVRYFMEHPVSTIFEKNFLAKELPPSIRQAAFLSASVSQFEIALSIITQGRNIVVSDRSFIDVVIFTELYKNEYNIKRAVENTKKIINYFIKNSPICLRDPRSPFPLYTAYIQLPKNDDFIYENCVRKDSTRKATIGGEISLIREKEKKFYEMFEKITTFLNLPFSVYPHPADSPDVSYDIVSDFIRFLDKKYLTPGEVC